MRYKFVIFGHEIMIRPENDVKLHTDVSKNVSTIMIPEEPAWEHSFPISKRVNVYTEYKGFIDYVFRDYSIALLNCGETALFHLEAILRSFKEQRYRFELKGATPEQLKQFDDKIYACFEITVHEVEDRTKVLAETNSEELQYHMDVLAKLKSFKIDDYYKNKI